MSVATATDAAIEQAHSHCAALTKSAAANFYYGIALLPSAKRRAMCAVYAFARRIDDIGDGELPADQKLALLEEQRAALSEIPPGLSDAQDLVAVALADSYRRFDLPLDALEDLIDGVRMDVEGASFQTFEDLVLYCRRVAGSIGRLSLAIFGAHDLQSAWMLADDLGVAMQLTNILRDLREDAQRGRVYLPSEDFVRYHLYDDGAVGPQQLLDLARQGAHAEASVVAGFGGGDVGQLFALMRFQALRAHDWFHRGMALVPLLDRRSAACVMAMTGIYRRLLWRIQDHPDLSLGTRMSLPVHSKAVVALSSVLWPRKVPERHPAERVL